MAPAALFLAACGGSDSDTTTSQPAPAATTAPSSAGADVAPTMAAIGTPTASTASPTARKLNLNTVSADELKKTIPNFPDRMVGEFQEYRPYVSIQQFRKEIGKYV